MISLKSVCNILTKAGSGVPILSSMPSLTFSRSFAVGVPSLNSSYNSFEILLSPYRGGVPISPVPYVVILNPHNKKQTM